jgi:hypothetical protein
MRWPWVSRDLLVAAEERIKASENYCMHWINRHDDLSARYDKLMDAFVALRVSGANATAPLAPAKRPSLPADIAIEDVVEARGMGSVGRRLLQRFVNMERQKQVDEEAIADRVRNWTDPDTDD